jgi:hypothetical protein
MSTTEEQPPAYAEDEEDEATDVWEEQSFTRRPRRRLLTPLTALLFAVLVGAGGFIAGVQVEKGEVSTTSSSGGSGRLASLVSGAASRSSAGGGGFGGAGGTVGQVANISGSDLYVTETQGNTVKVAASAAQITKQVSTSVKGVHPGDTVIVMGTHLPNGSIQAATVHDSGSTGAGGGLGALFGGSGGASTSGSNSSASGKTPSLFGG